MTHYDVFNGDADGLCALHQYRLAHPQSAQLITGIKRDVTLLQRVEARAGDRVQVFDISMERNAEALQRLLAVGVEVTYFDHHLPGEIPVSAHLQAYIDTAPTTCTSLLVNRYLNGAFARWAAVGAFGDNFFDRATEVVEHEGLSGAELEQLEALGTCLNYNGYGTDEDDLWFHPRDLYRRMQPYANPLDFIDQEPAFARLQQGYQADLAQAEGLVPESSDATTAVFVLPDLPWARRVSGVFANRLAREHPQRAHALLTELPGGYRVSVRAPLNVRTGADTLCCQFPGGGGRAAAAGINLLDGHQLDEFVLAFQRFYTAGGAEA